MIRLINADELKKYAIPCEIHNGALTEMCVPLYQIDNAPTVDFPDWYKVYEDVKGTFERPQGEWIPNYTSQFCNPGRSCSLCGKIVEFSENYCPQCGACMRGDNNA